MLLLLHHVVLLLFLLDVHGLMIVVKLGRSHTSSGQRGFPVVSMERTGIAP